MISEKTARIGANVAFVTSLCYQDNPKRIESLALVRIASYALGITALFLNTRHIFFLDPGKLKKKNENRCKKLKIDSFLTYLIANSLPTIALLAASFFMSRAINKRALPTTTLPNSCQWTNSSFQSHMQFFSTFNFLCSIPGTLSRKDKGSLIPFVFSLFSVWNIRSWKEVTSTILLPHANTPSDNYLVPKVTGFEFRNIFQVFTKPDGTHFTFDLWNKEISLEKVVSQMEKIRTFTGLPKDPAFCYNAFGGVHRCVYTLPKDFLPTSLHGFLSSFEAYVKSNLFDIVCKDY